MNNIADISWKDTKAKYEEAENLSCLPDKYNLKMLPNDYVFDEIKSVKWNRKQVELNNKIYRKERSRLMADKSKALQEVRNLIFEKIQYEARHDISRRQAQVIWDYACIVGRSAEFSEIYSHILDLIDFIDEFLFFNF